MTRILYVDDDQANLLVFESMCRERFDVVTTQSGEAALELMAQEEIAVLLADQRMPGMTGVELAERACIEHPEVVRILITAYSDLAEAIDAVNRGHIRGYLRKPWDQNELLAMLKEALSTHATRKRARELELRMLATERIYTLGVVSAGIAHDLRNPLSVLSESALLVKTRLEELKALAKVGVEPDEVVTAIDALAPFLDAQIGAAASMEEMCRSFATTSSVDESEEPCDLEELTRTASRIVLASKRQHGRMEMSLVSVEPVRGVGHKLSRIITNLLINAFDALKDGPAQGVVSVRLFQDGDHGVLEVEDNGPGICPADLERIFEAFYTTKGSNGTGLGLVISRMMTEEAGGTLVCESTLGGGSLFRLRLPNATT